MTDQEQRLSEMQDTISALAQVISSLKEQVVPAQLAKAVESSQKSTRSLRILCIILVICLVGSIGLGLVSLLNTQRFTEEAARMKGMRESLQADVDEVRAMGKELKVANEKVLKEVWESMPKVSEGVEDDIDAQFADLRKEMQKALARIERDSTAARQQLEGRLEESLSELQAQEETVVMEEDEPLAPQLTLRDVADVFNRVRIANDDILTAREKQLLTLLALQLEPRNPDYNYSVARSAYSFGKFDEALERLDVALQLEGPNMAFHDKAEQLKSRIEATKDNPLRLESRNPGRTRVGPYGIFDLHYNTLMALVDSGYLTVEQAQEILENSKKQIDPNLNLVP